MTLFSMWQRLSIFFVGILSLLHLQGCLATRGWVNEQMSPLTGRVSDLEGRVSGLDTRLNETNTRIDGVVERLNNLRLERRFVLNLREGANFSLNSGALTPETQSAVDGFLSDLHEIDDAIFLVAGHTDSLGSEDYNYELGQKRAANVARYLASKGIDPMRITAVSYGESVPVADNKTSAGRQQNRRVEILVYKEMISSTAGTARPETEVRSQDQEDIPVRIQ